MSETLLPRLCRHLVQASSLLECTLIKSLKAVNHPANSGGLQ